MKTLYVTMALLAALAASAWAKEDVSYQDIISSNPECRDYFWKGVEDIGAGKLGPAEADLKKAADKDKNSFLAYILLSQLAYARKDDAKSTSYLQQIPAEPPELGASYEDMIKALQADDFARVETMARGILKGYPQTMTAVATLHFLARAQYYTDQKDEARETFKAAFMYSDLAPGTVPAYGSAAETEEMEKFAGRR